MEDPRTTRPNVEALDAILGQKLPVLDDGFIRVVDYMGSDGSIVQAARVSYGKGTKKVHEDRGLIRYLMRHRHTTPFEMCEIKLHVRVPMDCWRQWIRHRTANVNEYSTRYSEAIDTAQETLPSEWRQQAVINRQGSSDVIESATGAYLSKRESHLLSLAREIYEERLEKGVAREQARKDLPLSTYTEAYWKIDLHNLFHFLSLRMDAHAQQEIRAYANVIGTKIVRRWCPVSWEAFEDYVLGGKYLTRLDSQVIQLVSQGKAKEALEFARDVGWMNRKTGQLNRNRERAELEGKLHELGIQVPWEDQKVD